MGFPSCCPFLTELDRHRELVAQEFDKLLGGETDKPCKGCNGAGQKRPCRNSKPCLGNCRSGFASALRSGEIIRAWCAAR